MRAVLKDPSVLLWACSVLLCVQDKPLLKYFLLHCSGQGPGCLQTYPPPGSDAFFMLEI